jgi:hypothetical protein
MISWSGEKWKREESTQLGKKMRNEEGLPYFDYSTDGIFLGLIQVDRQNRLEITNLCNITFQFSQYPHQYYDTSSVGERKRGKEEFYR